MARNSGFTAPGGVAINRPFLWSLLPGSKAGPVLPAGELIPLLAERRGPEWIDLLGMVSTINVKFP
jgi:hypothetical protein